MICQAVGCGAAGQPHRLPGFRATTYLCDDCARKRRATPLPQETEMKGHTLTLRTTETPAGYCRIEGCDSKSVARGLCPTHHAACRRAGTLEQYALPVSDQRFCTRTPQEVCHAVAGQPPQAGQVPPLAGPPPEPTTLPVTAYCSLGGPAPLLLPPGEDTMALREAAELLGIEDYDDGGEAIRDGVKALLVAVTDRREERDAALRDLLALRDDYASERRQREEAESRCREAMMAVARLAVPPGSVLLTREDLVRRLASWDRAHELESGQVAGSLTDDEAMLLVEHHRGRVFEGLPEEGEAMPHVASGDAPTSPPDSRGHTWAADGHCTKCDCHRLSREALVTCDGMPF